MSSSRSMIVGTDLTGDAWKGPEPSIQGMQDGSAWRVEVGVACHSCVLLASQPQPGVARLNEPFGASPVNPSSWPAARSRCVPQLDALLSWKVRSEMTKLRARRARFGICDGLNCW